MMVADKILRLLSESGFSTRAYADDVIIAIIADNQGIALGIAENLMKSGLSAVEKRSREVQLTVNPEKVEAVLFTRKYKTSPLSGLKLSGKEIKVSKEAKYFGVALDSKLNCCRHLEQACGKVAQTY